MCSKAMRSPETIRSHYIVVQLKGRADVYPRNELIIMDRGCNRNHGAMHVEKMERWLGKRMTRAPHGTWKLPMARKYRGRSPSQGWYASFGYIMCKLYVEAVLEFREEVGGSSSMARMTQVVGSLSVAIKKRLILEWSSNTSVQVKSSFHVRPLFFQRQVTLAEMVTVREPVTTFFECCLMAIIYQCVSKRSKYDLMALCPCSREV